VLTVPDRFTGQGGWYCTQCSTIEGNHHHQTEVFLKFQ